MTCPQGVAAFFDSCRLVCINDPNAVCGDPGDRCPNVTTTPTTTTDSQTTDTPPNETTDTPPNETTDTPPNQTTTPGGVPTAPGKISELLNQTKFSK